MKTQDFSVHSKAILFTMCCSKSSDCFFLINLILKEFNCGLQSNPEDIMDSLKIFYLYTNKENFIKLCHLL